MDPPASQEGPDPTPDLTGPLLPEVPSSHTDPPSLGIAPVPRPPKARTPPSIASPVRSGFPASEWDFPSTTFRSLVDAPLFPEGLPTTHPSDIFPPAASQPPAIDPSAVLPAAAACTPPAASQPPADDLVTQLQDLTAEMISLQESLLPPRSTAYDPHPVFFTLTARMRTLLSAVVAAPPSVHIATLAPIQEIVAVVDSFERLLSPDELSGPCLDLPPAADDILVAAAPPDPRPDPDAPPPDQGGASSSKKKRRPRRK